MRRCATLLLFVALFVAACGGGGDSAGPTTTAGVTGEDTTTTSAIAEAGSGECPQGSWLFSNEALQKFYDVIETEVGSTQFAAEGEAILDLNPDGTLAYRFEGYALDIEAGGTAIHVVYAGALKGTYTDENGVLLTKNLVDEDLEVTATMNGSTIDGSTYVRDLLNGFPINNAPYKCEGANLIIDYSTVNGRTPVTLTPA